MSKVAELDKKVDAWHKEKEANDLLAFLLGDMKVDAEQAQKFVSPNWLEDGFLVEGHIIVIPAEPNGGKTTIMWSLCPGFIQKGYDVWYINSDISSADVEPMIREAENTGINLILPDMGDADGMQEAANRLSTLSRSDVDLSGKVFIVDTLKKIGAPNDKNQMASFFKLCRRLTAMGATCILLAHTLKYYGDDVLPKYEGVGDIKSDCDDLIFLIPQKQPDDSLIVSTHPDKRRADIQPMSFRINPDRLVIRLDTYHDLKAEKAIQAAFVRDSENVRLIHSLLKESDLGVMNQTEILKETGLPKNAGILLLARYENRQWSMRQNKDENNQKEYRSLELEERYP